MIINKRCSDCVKDTPMYHNASRWYDCAMIRRKNYGRRRRDILRVMKKEHHF